MNAKISIKKLVSTAIVLQLSGKLSSKPFEIYKKLQESVGSDHSPILILSMRLIFLTSNIQPDEWKGELAKFRYNEIR